MEKEDKIQWHPGFYGAAEIELREDRSYLEFSSELELGKKPPKLDLLVIRKLAEKEIKNEIGKIFRRYNVVEYKSPEDDLTIDTLFKVMGYAFLYKANAEHVDEIPANELTVTLVRHICPSGLFSAMENYGFTVDKAYEGIYYTKLGFVPIQIIVTSELTADDHSALRILTRDADRDDVHRFLKLSREIIDDGNRENVDAVLVVSRKANGELFKEDITVSEELRELFSNYFEEAENKGKAEGLLSAAKNMLLNGLDVNLTAKCSGLTVEEVRKLAATL